MIRKKISPSIASSFLSSVSHPLALARLATTPIRRVSFFTLLPFLIITIQPPAYCSTTVFRHRLLCFHHFLRTASSSPASSQPPLYLSISITSSVWQLVAAVRPFQTSSFFYFPTTTTTKNHQLPISNGIAARIFALANGKIKQNYGIAHCVYLPRTNNTTVLLMDNYKAVGYGDQSTYL